MKNFALTGLAGYIAPRHLKAIRDTGNRLVAAADPHDSVGIIDSYFPDAAFFTEIERFDRHISKMRRQDSKEKIDYMSICSPNYLHDAQVRLALRVGANAICEKPLVLNPWNLDLLQEIEDDSVGDINTILQLRVHPSLLELRDRIRSENGRRHAVRLTYITSRGKWYKYSWKGDPVKSGGVSTNIGIHFFDLLMWLFGDVEKNEVHISEEERVGGFMALEGADVEWYLSLKENDLPERTPEGQSTYRSITVDGEEIEFSGGFDDLHTRVYEKTLDDDGFTIEDARPSIQLVHDIRNATPQQPSESFHPFVKGYSLEEV
ncbi:Gfo/Idh/MocA family oxidoreductase [Salinibacter ruber]|uniref:Gfo/Idh/MocA family oxidoreductase n=1 Tax=Salinibacter ruber TaxID=146919 RepID=UPI002168A5F2|nr:Gfo/Idh/MocA family oxidoreductase [Salinibacter ruber]MCS3702306.1 UDP-N-acetyl-2-amino-2-deoxyglucuronate dehydrogenase [Salinibacter ruber]